jgi:hypothetical protein
MIWCSIGVGSKLDAGSHRRCSNARSQLKKLSSKHALVSHALAMPDGMSGDAWSN